MAQKSMYKSMQGMYRNVVSSIYDLCIRYRLWNIYNFKVTVNTCYKKYTKCGKVSVKKAW